ncbi:hypothetical protein M2277_004167 [Paenibacillus sp. LBL]|uniref:hypothetical protein n=1 Tax=Paenibacillus sp. LBL TaxID=2940563 RepID=UPI0024742154|nr:hypothetical protein [Paenibacillus sp. LBL]MDH6673502.1 hypothetical protein [Paenibacillus sp. LBL]
MAKGITLQELDTSTVSQIALKNTLGNLSELKTINKDNTVAAINELFTNVSNGKTSVAAAITGKGVPASGGDEFAVLANKISQIKTGKDYYEANLGTIAASGHLTFNTGFLPRIVTVTSSLSGGDQQVVYTTTIFVFPYGGRPASQAPISSISDGGFMSIRKGDGTPYYPGDVADGKFLTSSFRVYNAQTAPWYNVFVRAWA